MIDVTEHLGLAQKIVWGFYPKVRTKYDIDDLLQVAYVGLVKAGNDFDDSRGIKFSTYAVPKIKGELIRFLKDDKKYNISRGVPHNYTMLSYEFENENGCLRDKLGSNDFEYELTKNMLIHEAINNLSSQEKKIFKLYFLDNLTQKQIGEICGMLQVQVSRVKIRISKKIKLAFMDCEKVSV